MSHSALQQTSHSFLGSIHPPCDFGQAGFLKKPHPDGFTLAVRQLIDGLFKLPPSLTAGNFLTGRRELAGHVLRGTNSPWFLAADITFPGLPMVGDHVEQIVVMDLEQPRDKLTNRPPLQLVNLADNQQTRLLHDVRFVNARLQRRRQRLPRPCPQQRPEPIKQRPQGIGITAQSPIQQ